ncbi:MAG: hypothetical protein LBI20_00625 [Holosporales bacterium]|jgi:hypothetical protein|nr:hypothetical protein [Holosporales bacterium]
MNKSSSIICFKILFGIGMCASQKFSADQLPLSKSLQKAFPIINSKDFIIVNIESRVILHGKRFNEKTPTGASLYDICTSLANNFYQKTHVIFFQICDSCHSCVLWYKNENSCTFLCILYGATSKQGLEQDIKLVSKWLDQFYLYKLSQQGEEIATIPVFYGKKNFVRVVLPEDHFVVLSKKESNNATKIVRYRTAFGAPIHSEDSAGCIFYKISTFQNFIIRNLQINTVIDKTNRFRTLCDSVNYLIFGAGKMSKESG